MKIGLVDVDSHNFPNLPLMKISAWHKSQNNMVEFYEPLNGCYDKVYISKIFDFTDDYRYPIYAKEICYGGTGYNLESTLTPEIESIYPDYSLYNITDTAYGFLTRGCPRKCSFCIVSKKEGCLSIKVADLEQFWKGQKTIKLLDPNLLACSERINLLKQLAVSKAYVDFTQGLDVRLVDEAVTELIIQCNVKTIHFAWDKEKDSSLICKKLRAFKKWSGINMRKAKVYVLVNFDTEFEFDLYRVYELKNLGYDPYIMIYDKAAADKKYKRLQRWVNNKIIFNRCDCFDDYRGG